MLYIVRHGQTKWNAAGIMNGRAEDTLNEKGVEMARGVGEKLRSVRFDAVFVSPLRRTHDTAKYILSLNIFPAHLREDERITERDMGDFTGKPISDFAASDRWRVDFPAKEHGMEALSDMLARTESFITEIKEKYKGKNVLVVTHNGALRGMRVALGDEHDKKDISALGVDNATVLTYNL